LPKETNFLGSLRKQLPIISLICKIEVKVKVTVIIPTYNYGAFIEESISSVFNQTRLPDEIIVVNDGSTDNTSEVLNKYSDKQISVITTTNQGVSAARNTGLDNASGDVIAFLDADDRWFPDMLDRQIKLIETDPEIVCVFSNFIRFNNWNTEKLSDQFLYYPELQKIPTKRTSIGFGKIIANDAFSNLIEMNEIPAFTQVMIFRMSAINDIRFNTKLVCCEDTNFVLKVFLKGRVAYNEEVLAEIRRHNDNATKDLKIFPKAKLIALKELFTDVKCLTINQRRALEERMLKAYANYSYFLIEENKLLKAWQNHYESLFVGSNNLKKLRITTKLLLKTIHICLIGSKIRQSN
jgi:glycosyltransferase involved in cell wall biosynthesis